MVLGEGQSFFVRVCPFFYVEYGFRGYCEVCFWLDVSSILLVMTGCGGLYEFGEAGDTGFPMRVASLDVLGFMSFMGHRCAGWDYDYVADGDRSLLVSSGGFYCKYVIGVDGGKLMRKCVFEGHGEAVLLDGFLYFTELELVGEVDRWIVSADVAYYLSSAKIVMQGPDVLSGLWKSFLDLSSLDGLDGDFGEIFDNLERASFYACYGEKFTKWLVLVYLDRMKNIWRLNNFMGVIRGLLDLNRDFLGGVVNELRCDEGRGEVGLLNWLKIVLGDV